LFILGLDYVVSHTTYAVVLIVVGLALTAWLVRMASTQTSPLVPVDLLKIAAIRSAIAASVFSFASQMATFVSLPFYLQVVHGHDPMTVGLLMTAWPLGAAVMAILAGRLADRVPVSILCGLGALAMTCSSVAITLVPQSAGFYALMAAMVLGGVGFGFFQTPNNRALLGNAPRERSGAVGGLQALTRVFGQTVGAALVAAAFTASQSSGATLGLLAGAVFASFALIINVRRYFKERVA
jgi:DHA2 family multidrug resistance protein-like MFS transporter